MRCKWFWVLGIWLLAVGHWPLAAQEKPPEVLITYNKFVYLMFPEDVQTFDLGVGSVYADFDGNILKLIPQASEVPETSLFVTTVNSHYYFVIRLDEDGDLEKHVYHIEKDTQIVRHPTFTKVSAGKSDIPIDKANVQGGKGMEGERSTYAGATADKNKEQGGRNAENRRQEAGLLTPRLRQVKAESKGQRGHEKLDINLQKVYEMEKKRIEIGKIGTGMGAYVGVIAYDRTYIYVTLLISNEATIDYEVDFIKFFVESRAGSKKGIQYEEELVPSGKLMRDMVISQDGIGKYVYAFEAFTMDKDKQLRVEIREKDGDRDVVLYVKGKDVLKAEMVE